jgi:sensor histidine kinase regulating citrate/malate metabolism
VVSWTRRLTPHTLAGKFLVFQLGVVGIVLLVAGLVSVRQSTSQFAAGSGERVLGAAENVAGNPLVKRGDSVNPATALAPVAEAARTQSGATVVLLTDVDRRIITSTDPTLLGTALVLPDESAWAGRSWDGDLTLAGQRLIAATVPTYSTAGDLLGLTLVGEQYPSTWSILRAGVPELLLLIALAAGAGVAGSWLLARRVKKQTHGLEPAQIASLADHREALLHSIREGVLGVGPTGLVTVVNDGARELLDLPADCVGRKVADLGLEPDLLEVVTGQRRGTDLVVLQGDRVLVVNRRTARTDRSGGPAGASSGTVITLRDRSELIAVQRQLGATRNATDTLRAQTHEFDNQLHVISGLLQLHEYDEVQSYVAGLTRRRAELDSAVTARIEDPPLAALLVAKSSLAAESVVQLQISTSSRCPRLAPDLSVDVATVVGNLVDNALDAVANSAQASITVEVTADDSAVHVVVSDTGPGVPPETRDHIFDRGFTTKSAAVVGGRGIGLSLVRRICEQRGGAVGLTFADGAVFTAVLPVEPPAPIPFVVDTAASAGGAAAAGIGKRG